MSPPLVLVVEDDQGIHNMLRNCLGSEFRFASAYSLKEMREYLQVSAKPDVILLDTGLPDSKRESTMEAVQSLIPEVPTVVLSGYDDMQLAISQGAQDFLLKGNLNLETIGSVLLKAQVRHKYRPVFQARIAEPIAEARRITEKLKEDSEITPLPEPHKPKD